MQLQQAPVLEPPRPERDEPAGEAAARRVPRSLLFASELAWRSLVCAAAVAVIAWALWKVHIVALPAFLALLTATILVPPARALMRHGVPAGGAAAIVFVGWLVALGALAALIVPAFLGEVDTLVEQVEDGARELGRLLASGPFGLSEADVERSVETTIERVRENSGRLAAGVVTGAVLVGQVLGSVLLTLVLLFFFVKDGEALWAWVVRQFPREARPRVAFAGDTGWRILAGYVRGVAFVAIVDALFIGLGLVVVGVPLALPLAVITFVAAFIPIVGAFVAGAAAALVALVAKGVVAALVVIGIVVLVQQLEGNLLYPLIVGRSVELHPVPMLLAVTGGAVIAGMIGALVAVPIAAVLAAVIPIARGRLPPPGLDPER